ncbi:MAG: hypothetical protein Q9222_007102 [Ikaeria aurantiellina]
MTPTAVSDDYQSNGKCHDHCQASYAFAVVQGKNCWCSNYAPADTTSIGSCSSPCPGFPYEQCGSDSSFGYISLNIAPLGTVGASQSQSPATSSVQVTTSTSQVVSNPILSPTSSGPSPFSVKASFSTSVVAVSQLSSKTVLGHSTSSSSSSLTTLIPSISSSLTASMQIPPIPRPVTVQQTTPSTSFATTTETTTRSTPVQSPTQYVPVPITLTTSSTPHPSPTTSTTPSTVAPPTSSKTGSSSTSTWTPTPITSVMTVTGQVKTITITPTAPPAEIAAAQSQDGGFMSHPGKVAGLFVGIGLIICLLAAALIWFFFRRRRRRAETETLASTAGGATPQRQQSKLSTMGLLGGTRQSNNRRSVPTIQTSGWGPGNNSTEKSPTETPIDYRRTSYPRIVDQRLEPAALWNPLQDNGSHVSIRSFRDDQDYSRRMLRVANPDDRPDSRN